MYINKFAYCIYYKFMKGTIFRKHNYRYEHNCTILVLCKPTRNSIQAALWEMNKYTCLVDSTMQGGQYFTGNDFMSPATAV